LLIVFIVAGLFSAVSLRQESIPEVQIPVAIVTTVFPGASALDVEQLLTNKVEEQLKANLTELNKLTSTSRQGVSVVVAEFDATADIEKSIAEVQGEVDKVKPELPEQAEDPVVSEVNFADQPILLISVSSDLPVSSFIDLTKKIEDEIERVTGVSRVEKSGIPEREVQVVVRKEALNKFGLSLLDVVSAIRASNSSVPAGTIIVGEVEYQVSFKGEIQDPSAIRDIAVLSVGGEPVYIRDLAFVSDGVSESKSLSRVSIGGKASQQAVSFSVFKQRGGDVVKIATAVKEKLALLEETILKGSTVLVSFDMAEFIQEDLRNLSLTGFQTILLVMLILLFSLGWREALVAGLAIPLSFLIAFIILLFSGNTINFVSLFALILGVGILVDSAIVVTEAIHTNRRNGLDKKEAALLALKEYHLPLTSGTMTTVAVFIPLFFISGITGKFIASIPFTIIGLLLASLVVALAIIPLVASSFLKISASGALERFQQRQITLVQTWYQGTLRKVLENKKKQYLFFAGLVFLFVLALSLPITGVVKVIFFPQENADFLYVDIEKPPGTPLLNTDLAARQVEEVLQEDSRIESFVTMVGSSSTFGDPISGTRLANITVVLKDERQETSTEILEELRKQFQDINTAKVRIFESSSGPPTGAPILVQLFSDDGDDLSEAGNIVENVLLEISGTTEITSSVNANELEFVLKVDRAKASEFGLTASTIAKILRTTIHGATATSLRTGTEEIDVVVKLNLNTQYRDPHDTARTTMDALRNLEIKTPQGMVLLGSFLKISVAKASGVIFHEDRARVATVSSHLQQGAIAGDVVKEFQEKMKNTDLPEGVTLQVGGENEDVDQSFQDMFVALIVGMLLVLSILVLQFNSFRQAFMIIIVVPISLTGILFGLALTDKALSFPSIMGFIALSGIVVNNSIILIDGMNHLRKQNTHMTLIDVVIKGAGRRLRPILLTTLTTVIGIFPLTYAAEIWAPLAFAVMFGLSFAAVLTLFLVPILYLKWPGRESSPSLPPPPPSLSSIPYSAM